jgi:DNA invertase Pin-like site-specific DNA recombinase
MIGCYVPVSSKQGQKTDSQVSELTKWLEANGHDPAKVQWYEDHESGKDLEPKRICPTSTGHFLW